MPVRALLSKLHQTHVCFWCLNESWVCFLFLSSINNNVSCLMSKIETKITNINQQELLILIHIYHKIKKGASASKQKNIVVSWLEKCFTISHVPWLLSVGFLSTHICHPKHWGVLLVLASWMFLLPRQWHVSSIWTNNIEGIAGVTFHLIFHFAF